MRESSNPDGSKQLADLLGSRDFVELKGKCRSEALEAIQEVMEALHDVGAIDKRTMRNFDAGCLTQSAIEPERNQGDPRELTGRSATDSRSSAPQNLSRYR